MADDEALTVRDFPPEVHASLAELQRIARRARSRHDPTLRWATPDEIALAETQRKPYHCIGHSGRTGLPCCKRRLLGSTVCVKHGASTAHVKAAADQRLRELVMPVIARQFALTQQSEHLPTAHQACADLLDRASIGALVNAKVRHSRQRDGATRVTVNIGFLSAEPAASPQAIAATVVTTDDDSED